jgi:hypothetical protein
MISRPSGPHHKGATGSPAGATRSRTLRSMATHIALRTADSILPPIRQWAHGSSESRASLAMCRSKLPGDVARDRFTISATPNTHAALSAEMLSNCTSSCHTWSIASGGPARTPDRAPPLWQATTRDSLLRSFDTNGKCGHAAEFAAREPLRVA